MIRHSQRDKGLKEGIDGTQKISSFSASKGINIKKGPQDESSIKDMLNFDIEDDGSLVVRKPLLLRLNPNIMDFIKAGSTHLIGYSVLICKNNIYIVTPDKTIIKGNTLPIKYSALDSSDTKSITFDSRSDNPMATFSNFTRIVNLSTATLITSVTLATKYFGGIVDPDVNPLTSVVRILKLSLADPTHPYLEILNPYTPSLNASNTFSFNPNMYLDNPYNFTDDYTSSVVAVQGVIPYIASKISGGEVSPIKEGETLPTIVTVKDLVESNKSLAYRMCSSLSNDNFKNYVILKAFCNIKITEKAKYFCRWEKTYDGYTWEDVPQFDNNTTDNGIFEISISNIDSLNETLDTPSTTTVKKRCKYFNPTSNENNIVDRPDILNLGLLTAKDTATYRFNIYTATGTNSVLSLVVKTISKTINDTAVTLTNKDSVYKGTSYILPTITNITKDIINVTGTQNYTGEVLTDVAFKEKITCKIISSEFTTLTTLTADQIGYTHDATNNTFSLTIPLKDPSGTSLVASDIVMESLYKYEQTLVKIYFNSKLILSIPIINFITYKSLNTCDEYTTNKTVTVLPIGDTPVFGSASVVYTVDKDNKSKKSGSVTGTIYFKDKYKTARVSFSSTCTNYSELAITQSNSGYNNIKINAKHVTNTYGADVGDGNFAGGGFDTNGGNLYVFVLSDEGTYISLGSISYSAVEQKGIEFDLKLADSLDATKYNTNPFLSSSRGACYVGVKIRLKSQINCIAYYRFEGDDTYTKITSQGWAPPTYGKDTPILDIPCKDSSKGIQTLWIKLVSTDSTFPDSTQSISFTATVKIEQITITPTNAVIPTDGTQQFTSSKAVTKWELSCFSSVATIISKTSTTCIVQANLASTTPITLKASIDDVCGTIDFTVSRRLLISVGIFKEYNIAGKYHPNLYITNNDSVDIQVSCTFSSGNGQVSNKTTTATLKPKTPYAMSILDRNDSSTYSTESTTWTAKYTASAKGYSPTTGTATLGATVNKSYNITINFRDNETRKIISTHTDSWRDDQQITRTLIDLWTPTNYAYKSASESFPYNVTGDITINIYCTSGVYKITFYYYHDGTQCGTDWINVAKNANGATTKDISTYLSAYASSGYSKASDDSGAVNGIITLTEDKIIHIYYKKDAESVTLVIMYIDQDGKQISTSTTKSCKVGSTVAVSDLIKSFSQYSFQALTYNFKTYASGHIFAVVSSTCAVYLQYASNNTVAKIDNVTITMLSNTATSGQTPASTHRIVRYMVNNNTGFKINVGVNVYANGVGTPNSMDAIPKLLTIVNGATAKFEIIADYANIRLYNVFASFTWKLVNDPTTKSERIVKIS